MAWIPACDSFVDSDPYSPGFDYYSLTGDDQYNWALLTRYFQANIQAGKNVIAALAVSSGYRNPESERAIDSSLHLPFYKNSRHEYGDGVDFKTPSGESDYMTIRDVFWNRNIDGNIACVEPYTPGQPHAHVDWRTDSTAENRSSVCPTTSAGFWGKH